jgi:hypothetical protein
MALVIEGIGNAKDRDLNGFEESLSIPYTPSVRSRGFVPITFFQQLRLTNTITPWIKKRLS